MSSVEELCDEISLINRSHNILSGPVREIRERFSNNRYELGFVGAPDALDGCGFDVELGAINPDGFATATVTLPAADAVRPFLAAANQAVEINSFRRLLPSMDDIFVSAVEASNQSSQQQTKER